MDASPSPHDPEALWENCAPAPRDLPWQEFANPSELRHALAEFSRVTGCGWAGRMLAGLAEWKGDA